MITFLPKSPRCACPDIHGPEVSDIDLSFQQPTVIQPPSLPLDANQSQHIMSNPRPKVSWEDPSVDSDDVILRREPTVVTEEKEETQQMDSSEYSFSRAVSSRSKSVSGSSTSSESSDPGICSSCLQAIGAKIRPYLNSRTKRILTISSIVSLCFIIGTIIYVAIALNQIQSNYNWVVHTDTVKVNIDNLYISLLNADSSSRGYVITGSPSYLGPYNNSVESTGNNYVWSYFYQISNLTTDNPVQIANCAELEPLIVKRLALLAMVISDYQTDGFIAAQYDIVTYSMSVMTTIRGLLSNMTMEESSLLVQRQATFSSSIKTISIVLFVMLPCVIFIIIAGLLSGHSWDTKLLKRVNKKLELLLEKAHEGTKTKNLFLANISHEIRTPMNGVLAMTQLLSSTVLSPDQHDIVDTILTSAEAMMRLINDLLLFSKIEAGKFTLIPEWFELSAFLAPLTEMCSVRAGHKNIGYVTSVDANVPKYLLLDSGRLRQVLINLCDNSIKFTHRGHVKLHITLVKKSLNLIETPTIQKGSDIHTLQPPPTRPGLIQGDVVNNDKTSEIPIDTNNIDLSTEPRPLQERYYMVFRVIDTGIGIASEAQKHIFEPFRQADNSTTREYGGTGLGLSISSQLVKIMGSKLKLRSQPGWGSVFEFAIPITSEQLTHSSEMAVKGSEAKKHDDSEPGTTPLRRESRGVGAPGNSEDDRQDQMELTRDASNASMVGVGSPNDHLQIQQMPIIPETDSKDNSDPNTTQSASILSSGSSSISGSSIRSIKWHDWFSDEYYDSSDRAEQKQIMSTPPPVGGAGSDQFSLPLQSLERSTHSAPLPDISTPKPQGDQLTPIMIDMTPPAPNRAFSYNVSSSLTSSTPVTNPGLASRKIPTAFITPGGPRLRILVVEDNPINQKVARRLLERDGHIVILANHGQEGVDLWSNDPHGFDVVLMDLQMPVMDGMTATRCIREQEGMIPPPHDADVDRPMGRVSEDTVPPSHREGRGTRAAGDINQEDIDAGHRPLLSGPPRRVPIIAVTASALEEDVKKCMEGGFDGVIHKPIDIRLLSQEMGKLIAKKVERPVTVNERKENT